MRILLNIVFLALALATLAGAPARAQTEALDTLFEQLAEANEHSWQKIEQDIWSEWSKSGSASMDLLLDRGRQAMAAGDLALAIGHLTALIDHAPNFAEGWNARATAYFQAGLYGPSIEDIQRTLALNPRHFGAIAGLARILEDLGHPQDALEMHRKILAIHPFRPNLEETIERLEKEVGGTDI